MDSSLTFQFENTCRACMRSDFENSNQSNQLQSVFDYINDFEEKKLQICDLLNITITQLPKIVANDPLPKFVCKFCVEKVCAFYEFQSCCIKSDLNLRKLIAPNTTSDLTDPLQSAIIEPEVIVKEETIDGNEFNYSIQSKENESRIDAEETEEIITPEFKCDKDISSIIIKDEINEDSTEESAIEEFLDNENVEQELSVLKIENEIFNNFSNNEQNSNQKTEQTVWFCPVCSTTFINRRKLTEHAKRGNDQCKMALKEIIERFSCDQCKRTFTEKKNLNRHMTNMHNIDNRKTNRPKLNSSKISTEIAKNAIKNEDTLISDPDKQIQISLSDTNEQHIQNEGDSLLNASNPRNIENSDTDSEEDNEFLIEQELQGTDKKLQKNFSCPQCQRTFTEHRNLNRHMLNKHKIDNRIKKPIIKRPVISTENGYTIKLETSLITDSYKEIQTSEENNEIQKDQKLQSNDKDVQMGKTMNAMNWFCNICQRIFATKKNLQRHIRNLHATSPRPLKCCQYCDKKFLKGENLKNHERKHKDEKAYLCAECGKTFASGSTFRIHLVRHTGEKLHVCPQCPKHFISRSDVCKHVRQVHCSERPFVCDVCDASFKTPNLLKIHKQIHTGKRYQCEYCDMKFSKGEHMRRHMRTHTGEKPFKCEYCTRTFNSRSDLTQHSRLHLGENIYQCELCPESFRLDRELRAHFATHKHDDEETTERNRLARLEVLEKLKQKLAKESLIS